jgi:hypothetical protein
MTTTPVEDGWGGADDDRHRPGAPGLRAGAAGVRAAGPAPPREVLRQATRAFQRRPAFAPWRPLRQAAEHRLARLRTLGVRQARDVGGTQTLFPLRLAATVANLTLAATAGGLLRGRRGRLAAADALARTPRAALRAICHLLVAQKPPARRHPHRLSTGFRPHF